MGKKKEHKIIKVPNCNECNDLLNCIPLGGNLNFKEKCIFIEVEV